MEVGSLVRKILWLLGLIVRIFWAAAELRRDVGFSRCFRQLKPVDALSDFLASRAEEEEEVSFDVGTEFGLKTLSFRCLLGHWADTGFTGMSGADGLG